MKSAWWLIVLTLGWASGLARADPLEFERRGLGWTAEEVAQATHEPLEATLQQATAARALGCRTQCDRIAGVWSRVVQAVPPSGQPARLRLHVVRLKDVEAFAVPSGDVVIGEPFIEQQKLSDEGLAFVLAHEIAHVLLQHERQSLTAARAVLPPVQRTVADMYVELQFNFGLLRMLEPIMQASELEADDFGLQLAALAGYDPRRQIRFLLDAAETDEPRRLLVATHPSSRERAAQVALRLPLALRVWQQRLESRTADKP